MVGHDQLSYHLIAHDDGYQFENRSNGFTGNLSGDGLRIHQRNVDWSLRMVGFGYGDSLQTIAGGAPLQDANHVEYHRSGITEWYSNGPSGVEQGFTLSSPPKAPKSGPLTVAMHLSGNLLASVNPDQLGLTLSASDSPVFRYAGLSATDAKGRTLHSWMELSHHQVRLRVDDSGAVYPITIDPFAQAIKLEACDGQANDELGFSIALSSDSKTLVVGAPDAMVGGQANQGAAYVFLKPANLFGWNSISPVNADAKLVASDGTAGDNFGFSVGISSDGSTIVAGAASATVTGNPAQGAGYVFVRPASGWVGATSLNETAKLTSSNGAADDFMGNSGAVSGDGGTIVMGALFGSGGNGALYVFSKPSGGWTNTSTYNAELTASDGSSDAELGSRVGLSADGSVIVGGAPGATVSSVVQGAVYVFVEGGSGWTSSSETAKLTASDGVSGDANGHSVAVSADGSTVVGGAALKGSAYVYTKPGAGWASETQVAELTPSDASIVDDFGISAAANTDGSIVAIGAQFETVGSNSSQGEAYVYARPSGGWTDATENAKLDASDGTGGDQFGSAISVSGDGGTVAVGSHDATIGSNAKQGAAYIFTGSATTPAPIATVVPSSLTFGSQAVGTTSGSQVVKVTNSGTMDLHIASVAINEFCRATSCPADFSTTTNCAGRTITAGNSCTESVSFGPNSVASLNATLVFTDDSGGTSGSTQDVALSGTGTMASSSLTVSASPSAVVPGQTVTVSFSVAPQSGDTLSPTGTVTVSANSGESCSGAAPSGSCTLTFTSTGMHTITASYGGDSNFTSSSNGTSVQVVNFTVSATPASQTIPSGHMATYSVAVSGAVGDVVALSCAGGPANSTCAVSPASETLTSANGSAKATVMLQTKQNVNHGTSNITITARIVSVSKTATVSLTVK